MFIVFSPRSQQVLKVSLAERVFGWITLTWTFLLLVLGSEFFFMIVLKLNLSYATKKKKGIIHLYIDNTLLPEPGIFIRMCPFILTSSTRTLSCPSKTQSQQPNEKQNNNDQKPPAQKRPTYRDFSSAGATGLRCHQPTRGQTLTHRLPPPPRGDGTRPVPLPLRSLALTPRNSTDRL